MNAFLALHAYDMSITFVCLSVTLADCEQKVEIGTLEHSIL